MAESKTVEYIPRTILVTVGLLVGFSLIAVLIGRYGDLGTVSLANGEPTVERQLRFEDRSDGGIDVIELPAEEVIYVVGPGTNGFLRGVLRGMARTRKLEGLGANTPFILTGWQNGTMSLEDPLTGRRVPLDAFGPTNAQAFARLLWADGKST